MRDQKLANYAIIFMGLALLAVVLQLFQDVTRPFAIALLLLFITTPLVEFSHRKHIPVWITFLGLFVAAVGLLSLVGTFVAMDAAGFSDVIPQLQQKIRDGSGSLLKLASKLGIGPETVSSQDIAKIATKVATAGLAAIRTIISETLLALILLMFIVQSRSGIFAAVERRYGNIKLSKVQEDLHKIQDDIIAYFGTKALMSLGTALLSLVVLILFGAQFISISALLIFLLNFIPIVGSLIAVVLVIILYLLTAGLSATVVWLLLALMAVQIFFGNILEPKLTGKKLSISPILILISLYVWNWIWGIVGMFLSVPLTIVIVVMIRHLRKGDFNTSESTG